MIRRLPAMVAMLSVIATGCTTETTMLDQFRHTIASHDSATVALEEWCGRRGIMAPVHIQAVPLDDADQSPATPAIRAALNAGADDLVRVRHVQLYCANTVLSDAYNWYVPARLTPDMNRTLETTRTPFGRVVAPLGLHRQPLPPGTPSPASCPADTIQHETAVLRRNDGMPYSLVSECYTPANIRPR